MKHLRTLLYGAILFSLLITLGGCCSRTDSSPARPNSVRGWQAFRKDGLAKIGEFVLIKGEATSSGDLGVAVVEIVQGRKCSGTESVGPIAKIKFYRISNSEVLLEIERPVGSIALSDFSPVLAQEFGISSIFIAAINTKDSWVWFELS